MIRHSNKTNLSIPFWENTILKKPLGTEIIIIKHTVRLNDVSCYGKLDMTIINKEGKLYEETQI